jgi:hypothetical protein
MKRTIDNLSDISNSLKENINNPLLICLKYSEKDCCKTNSVITALNLINDYDIDYENDFCFLTSYFLRTTFNNMNLNKGKNIEPIKKNKIKFEEKNFIYLPSSFPSKILFKDFSFISNNKKIILIDDLFYFSRFSIYKNYKKKLLIEVLNKNKNDIFSDFYNLIHNLMISSCQNNQHIFFIYNIDFKDEFKSFIYTIENSSDVVLSIEEDDIFLEKTRIEIKSL